MKASAIIRIVIYLILLAFLVSIFALGMYWHQTGSLPWNLDLHLGGISFGGYTYRNSGAYSVGADKIDPTGITRLEINWMDGAVNILPNTGNQIQLTEDTSLAYEDQLRYLVSEDTLIIQYAAPRTGLYQLNDNKQLTVALPESVAQNLQEIQVDAVSANVHMQDITANTCDIDNVSGDYEITGCDFGQLVFDSVSGRCNLTGSARKLELDTMSGNITLNLTNAPQEISMDTVSGDLSLTLPEGTGFTAEFDSVSGDLNCNQPMTKKGDQYICGNGAVEIEADSVSGDLILTLDTDDTVPR